MLKKSGQQQQQQQPPQRMVRQLEDDIKRSLGLSEVGFQQQLAAQHAGFLPGPPPGLQQPHPFLLHHLQQQQQQQIPAAARPPQQQRQPQLNSGQDSDMSAFKKLVNLFNLRRLDASQVYSKWWFLYLSHFALKPLCRSAEMLS